MGQRAPKGIRLHIGLFGRRNVGKSSLLNAITRQQVSIVSEQAGTTTDPVEKPMELLPLGPVLFIDTAGIDDVGALGELRVKRTRQVFERTDLGVLITEPNTWGAFEEQLLEQLRSLHIPVLVVFNKIDLDQPNPAILEHLISSKIPVVKTAASQNVGILDFRQALLDAAPPEFINNPAILADLIGPGEMAVLVIPIDKEAPKGRLILPQVQAIRDLLDNDSCCVIVKERELRDALESLKRPPRLVVTDSQVFLKVAADTPRSIKLTSFSILFARYKGNLLEQVLGALAIKRLKRGDRILIAEACSHHPIAEDIGRVKIPRWLTQFVGGKLEFDTVQGHDFPENLSIYKLIVHCGACMLNRREMLSRHIKARRAGVPLTNYGLVIAYSLGILERALEPFPSALDLLNEHKECPHEPPGNTRMVEGERPAKSPGTMAAG
ncbi:MAG: [FeFe] hydrogenase H-cluster maturation GTPase HydF [Candidatus Abyssobacteria bacterium SURF_5]|uniref:[FeFe] hydrogenase H-cluster maturation GTPase HydF n=1 Tax=Abyssobacteria bacterium (strain SURF_5) TaxID=2093360 RepID=A0A3A4NLZ6_ABYX5|nr:MAG: [FeFe] hydrogenase H-cluster maturation GTPase HydF [Candidatus Abyssubacteria bacterium SURF_5]